MWKGIQIISGNSTVVSADRFNSCGCRECWPFGVNFIMSLGIMYSVCGRKQETDREVIYLFITDEGCNLEEREKKRANELPFCKSKPNRNQ